MSLDSKQPASAASGSLIRQVGEFVICLSIAVILFKGFLVEGYVITTGSMAPTLLGNHKQVVCPSCQSEFALGVSNGVAPARAVCPNCDLAGIGTESLFANDGDQVLVNKSAYEFRPPRRWEVAVFHNPNDLTEAYVKRIIGLPGESVQVRRGDVLINGEIARKPLSVQRGLRILVHDLAHQPSGDDLSDWRPRWIGDQPWWQPRAAGFAVDTRPEQDRSAQWTWLTYRHWLRSGGRHTTKLKLAQWPSHLALPSPDLDAVFFDEANQQVVCRGAMPDDARERLVKSSRDRKFQAVIEQLYTESHIAPVTDLYAYNRQVRGNGDSAIVRDLMLATTIDFKAGQGEFCIEMDGGAEPFQLIFDTTNQQVRLQAKSASTPVRTAPLPDRYASQAVLVEMSLFDRQVLCALNGTLLFEPWELPSLSRGQPVPRRQVRLGAKGIRLHVQTLQLFRDIYYTADGDADTKTWKLSDHPQRGEYFVLGDNSPVSIDSRLWDRDTVLTSRLLIGKPLVVHLPARTGQLKWGSWETRLRIPDLSRIRFVR